MCIRDRSVGQWLQSFLMSKKQSVIVNGVKTQSAPVISGNPQGSVIGLSLFLMLIADINKDISSSFLSSFADDTRVGSAIESTDDASKLQEDLHTVYNWAEKK